MIFIMENSIYLHGTLVGVVMVLMTSFLTKIVPRTVRQVT